MTEVAEVAESRAAFNELLELLRKIDTDYLAPGNHVFTPEQVAAGHRFIMHVF
jgi:hypothetical protein